MRPRVRVDLQGLADPALPLRRGREPRHRDTAFVAHALHILDVDVACVRRRPTLPPTDLSLDSRPRYAATEIPCASDVRGTITRTRSRGYGAVRRSQALERA